MRIGYYPVCSSYVICLLPRKDGGRERGGSVCDEVASGPGDEGERCYYELEAKC